MKISEIITSKEKTKNLITIIVWIIAFFTYLMPLFDGIF